MPLVNLGKLKLGAVLLECEDEKLARGTGKTIRRFGDASLLLGPLVRITDAPFGATTEVAPKFVTPSDPAA